ncbi:MAG: hypothetical protein JJT81_11840 [Rubellimicrobium sp.]|nr:hypothetical protein [Rubellimicrobium sp.]
MDSTRTRLSDLPAEAQDILRGMSRQDRDALMFDVHVRQFEDRQAAYPADAEAAAKGAKVAMAKPAALVVDDPLSVFVHLYATIRLTLVFGSMADLDREDAESVLRLVDLAKDLLDTHVANVDEARDRLRAHTHPVPGRQDGRAEITTPKK